MRLRELRDLQRQTKVKPKIKKSKSSTISQNKSRNNGLDEQAKPKIIKVKLEELITIIINQDIEYLNPIINIFGTEFLITCRYNIQGTLYLKLTPLLIAIFNNSLRVVKWLIEKKNAKINTIYGLPLVTAIWKNNLEITDYLFQKKAQIYPKSVIMPNNKNTSRNEINYECVENKNLDLLKIISQKVDNTDLIQLVISKMSFGINTQIERNPQYINDPELELDHWNKYFTICIENSNYKLMSVLLYQLKTRFSRVDESWMNQICRLAIDHRDSHCVLLLLPEGADPSIISQADRIKLGWSTWRHEKKTIIPSPLCLISHDEIEDGEEYVICQNTHYFKYIMWKEWSNMGKDTCPYCRQNFYPSVIYIQ